MATEVKTYNPQFVLVTVAGVPMGGYADGTFVEVAPMSDASSSQSGADGEVARAIGTDMRHTVTITLQQTSDSNDVLSGIAERDRQTRGGAMVPVLVQDLTGRTLFLASQGWISRRPNLALAKEIQDRAWQLTTGEPSVFVEGGNF